jgi:hypothetical protein
MMMIIDEWITLALFNNYVKIVPHMVNSYVSLIAI